MITSVTIEGFKSFGAPGKPTALGPLNFIVGANASGKTNFVSALKFLHLAVTDGLERTMLRPEFDGPRGIRNHLVFSKKRSEDVPMAIAIRVKGPFPGQSSGDTESFCVDSAFYRLAVGFDAKTTRPFVHAETLAVDLKTPKGAAATYSLVRNGDSLEIKDPLNTKLPEQTTKVPVSVRSRLAVEEWSFGPPALWFHQWMSRWRFFGITPNVARSVARESSEKDCSLVVVEHPEISLHPHLVEELVATFRALSADRQVIATTHSPEVLQYLDPEELLLCERDGNAQGTVLVPAHHRENVRLFRHSYALGELWVQGALEGIPQ